MKNLIITTGFAILFTVICSFQYGINSLVSEKASDYKNQEEIYFEIPPLE